MLERTHEEEHDTSQCTRELLRLGHGIRDRDDETDPLEREDGRADEQSEILGVEELDIGYAFRHDRGDLLRANVNLLHRQ